ncbi:MAG: hypothetical protein ICV84_15460 [Flavisolibacter sp.]|nr:hypothetical protein [Flavisolibacter sp.]
MRYGFDELPLCIHEQAALGRTLKDKLPPYICEGPGLVQGRKPMGWRSVTAAQPVKS